ncbi:MAG: iron-sulfur cluster assembly accessory protein [Cyclobacteriaceae bacterium]|nr:iron-sulfur cluster assembly accessory protein [Cyclobacteriaceae bacterium]
MNNLVSITDNAAIEVKNIMSNKNIPEGYGLRIGMKGGGGCGAGMTHMLGFDKEKEGDIQYESQGIMIYIEKKHLMYLIGLQVDFYEGDDKRGFVFNHPEQEKN